MPVISITRALLVAAVATPSAAAQTGPPQPVVTSAETTRAPSPSPETLIDVELGVGRNLRRGERLPAGSSIVRRAAEIPAGAPAGTRVDVELRCPAGELIVSGPLLEPRRGLTVPPPGFGPVRQDSESATTVTLTRERGFAGASGARVLVVCLERGRIGPLRARQEQQAIAALPAAAAARVRAAPRRRVCPLRPASRQILVHERPGVRYTGTVVPGDAIRLLRRSPSGRYAEIFDARSFVGIGWIRAAAVCPR